MNETNFDLIIRYKDDEMIFPAQFLRTGYSYKIQVEVFGSIIDFEPDEERNWRALVSEDQVNYNNKITRDLLLCIAISLEEITK